MARKLRWERNHRDSTWEASGGFSYSYVVQHSRKAGKWYVWRREFIGFQNLMLGQADTRKEAQAIAERIG